jgi:heptosyltransferase-3
MTPLLRELQLVYPGAEIDVVSRSPVADDIFGKFRCVRHVYRLPRHGLAAPLRLARVVRELRARRYDLAIDPCIRSQSDRIGVLAARAKYTIGYIGPGKYGGLTHAVAAPESVFHVGKLPVHLLRGALGRDDVTPYPGLDICLTDAERERGAELIASVLGSVPSIQRPAIALFCNATGAKNLGTDWWRRFAAQVQTRWPNYQILEIIPATGGSMLDDRYPAYYSSDLRRLASVISAANLFVSADCGVMHLACAAGTPTIALFAITDPAEWGPYGPGNTVIEIADRNPEQAADALPTPVQSRAHATTQTQAGSIGSTRNARTTSFASDSPNGIPPASGDGSRS